MFFVETVHSRSTQHCGGRAERRRRRPRGRRPGQTRSTPEPAARGSNPPPLRCHSSLRQQTTNSQTTAPSSQWLSRGGCTTIAALFCITNASHLTSPGPRCEMSWGAGWGSKTPSPQATDGGGDGRLAAKSQNHLTMQGAKCKPGDSKVPMSFGQVAWGELQDNRQIEKHRNRAHWQQKFFKGPDGPLHYPRCVDPRCGSIFGSKPDRGKPWKTPGVRGAG